MLHIPCMGSVVLLLSLLLKCLCAGVLVFTLPVVADVCVANGGQKLFDVVVWGGGVPVI